MNVKELNEARQQANSAATRSQALTQQILKDQPPAEAEVRELMAAARILVNASERILEHLVDKPKKRAGHD